VIAPAAILGGAMVAASLLVAQASPPASQAPSSPPTPVPASATPAVGAPASATPAAVATPVYTFVYRASPQPVPPPDVPVIAEIDLSATALTPPAPLHVRVLTSAAVVSVYAQTSLAFLTRGIPIPKAQSGLFLFDGYIPDVPSIVRNHTFNVTFIATAANGTTANVSIPLRLN
jgi:hypothetical protein